MILALETAILDRLTARLPKQLLVEGFPDDAKAFEKLPWNKGVVLVAYKESQFTPPQGMGLVTQGRTLQFEVQLRTKGLRSHQGAYAYLDAIRAALTGFRPGATGVLYPVSEQFVGAEEFVWTYAQVYSCEALHLETRDSQPEPLMTRATFVNHRFGDTVEIPRNEA